MSTNPDFIALYSTNEIYRANDRTVCFEDQLVDLENTVAGKAPASHTHTGFAAADHTHTGYAASEHTHTGFAASSHEHDDKADLVNGRVPIEQLPDSVDEVIEGLLYNNKFYENIDDVGNESVSIVLVTGKLYVDNTTNKVYRYRAGEGLVEVGGVPAAKVTEWDSKAAGDHDHDADYIGKSLQFTADDGKFEYTYAANSGTNLLTAIAAWPAGPHTCYSAGGLTGNPNTVEAFRVFAHKTEATVGWILAFGSSGSVYSNYQYGATAWRGWRTIHEATPTALWTGNWYVNGGQTVTPSKPLSQCRNGWMLLWSDFDTSTNTSNNADFCVTYIPRRNWTGGAWSGQSFLVTVPVNATETDDVITVKRLYVSDDSFTGHAHNGVNPRNDVALRAVYEF